MKTNACEIAFANSAYLSELWAIRDLARVRALDPLRWGPQLDEQLRDEVRHARMLLEFLKSSSTEIVVDLNYSMQERLYRQYVDLGTSKTVGEVCAVHDVTEWRAAWIYRTFLKTGESAQLKQISSEILEDEKRHASMTGEVISSGEASLLTSALRGIDRRLFRRDIPERFGRQLLHSSSFWSFYFEGAPRVSTAGRPASYGLDEVS